MRGQSLFNELFNEPSEPKSEGENPRIDFLDRRYQKLVARFYYHAYLKKSFETYRLLSNEFDWSERHIIDVIGKKRKELRQLKDDKTTVEDLRKRYPYFNWKI